jgi:hypothetical protein
MKNIVLILLLFTLSCKVSQKIFYGTNKILEFKSLAEYKNYIFKKYDFDLHNLYYLEGKDYDTFMDYIFENKLDYFLGTFENDSTQFLKSAFLRDNQSCYARIETEVRGLSPLENLNKISNPIIKNTELLNINTQKKLDFAAGKRKVILLISYKFGNIHKNDFNKLEALIKNLNDYELCVISLDRIFNLE